MERVIFDTNAYRYLVTDKETKQIEKLIKKLKKKEDKRGLESLVSPIVARELLAHVADKHDPAYEKCLKAIKAMYLHNGDESSYRLLASPDMLVANAFFHQTLPQKEETNKALMQMAYHIAMKPTENAFKKLQRNLNLNRDQVLGEEQNFAQAMLQFVRQTDPTSTGWQVFPNDQEGRTRTLAAIRSTETSINLAAGLIYTVFMLLRSSGKEIELSYEGLYDLSSEFVRVFPEYIALYKLVFENMVNSEFNLLENSRSNFYWDIQLMLNIGDHSIGGDKLYFVTSDKAIINTAIGQNAKYTILTFDEYMDYVN